MVNLGRNLLVADYWGRRLRMFPLAAGDGGDAMRPATRKLAIHPDNLTRAGDWILIAGQRHAPLTSLNLGIPSLPSPSAVYRVRVDALPGTEEAEVPEAALPEPMLLWEGGWRHGRSVSVAVPVPGGFALGQIRTPGVLIVSCPGAGP
jgi:hypothetical protein